MHVQVQCSSSFNLLAALRTADDLLATCEVISSIKAYPQQENLCMPAPGV